MVNWNKAFVDSEALYGVDPNANLFASNNLVQDDSFARFQSGDYPAFDFAGLDYSLEDSISNRLNSGNNNGFPASNEFTILGKMGSIFHDDWFASDENFGENLSRAILIPFDLVATGASSMEEFTLDLASGSSFYDAWTGRSMFEKVNSIIDSGYLASGETLTNRTSIN